jgi:glycerol-3-phosphate O-acyltransferase
LVETVDTLLSFLKKDEVPMAATLSDPSTAVQETLSLLVGWKMVDLLEGEEGAEDTFYYAEEDRKIELEYYKNSIIHFFIPYAFVATSLLSGKEEVKSAEAISADCTFLKNLFRNEFVFDEDEDFRQKLAPAIDYFLDAGFLSRSDGDEGYIVTKLGFDKLPIWAALAKTFVESYWIAVKTMVQRKDLVDKNEELLKQMNYLGKRLHKLGFVDHIGALSRLNYANAASFINREILRARSDSEQDPSSNLEKLSQLGQRLYELSHYGQ